VRCSRWPTSCVRVVEGSSPDDIFSHCLGCVAQLRNYQIVLQINSHVCSTWTATATVRTTSCKGCQLWASHRCLQGAAPVAAPCNKVVHTPKVGKFWIQFTPEESCPSFTMEVGEAWGAVAGYREDRVVSVVMTLHRLIRSLKNPAEAEVSRAHNCSS